MKLLLTFFGSALIIHDIILVSKEKKYTYISLTDFNSLSGIIDFCSKTNKNGLKPIIGVDLGINEFLVTFIVKTDIGYKKLLCILDFYNNKEFLNEDIFDYYKDGLVVIISPKQSDLLNKLSEQEFHLFLNKMKSSFSDKFFIGLEIYNNDNKSILKANKIRAFVKKNDINVVAFPFIKYKKPSHSIK